MRRDSIVYIKRLHRSHNHMLLTSNLNFRIHIPSPDILQAIMFRALLTRHGTVTRCKVQHCNHHIGIINEWTNILP